MLESTNYIFAASFSSLSEPLPQVLSHRFTGTTIPPGQTVSPFEGGGLYEAVDFYSNKPLNIGNPKAHGRLCTLKNAWTATPFKAAAKQPKYQGSKSHQKRINSLSNPPQCKYEIVRYELKPKLPFTLEHRLWYPVEQAWQVYNYDMSYLSGLQIEHLEKLQKERNYALYMMRRGHPSYWRMVRDAEISMFGNSPEFGRRPKEGRTTPLLERGRSELFSYKARRGKSARFQAADGFEPKGQSMHENGKSLPQGNRPTFIPRAYGQALDSIAEEKTAEPHAETTAPSSTRPRMVRKRVLVSPKSSYLRAVPSLATAMREPLNLNLQVNSGKRPSTDSGFAESLSVRSAGVPVIWPEPTEVDSAATNSHTLPHDKEVDVFPHQHCATATPMGDIPRFPLYKLTLDRVQSAVDKAVSIRRSGFDPLKRVCRARRDESTGVTPPQDIQEEEEEGVPLFKPWTIGDQSIVTYRNPRKWVLIVKDKFMRTIA